MCIVYSTHVFMLFVYMFTCLNGYLLTEVRQTITEYTMYIDGSSFYGSNEKDYPDLRTFIGGETIA